ncbi:MAG TPA: beta-propeller domain-containing protein [Gemmatimonadales bacterium]|nr:beta-propeller domain-containing protein [Gemmatimonadales bacterium]
MNIPVRFTLLAALLLPSAAGWSQGTRTTPSVLPSFQSDHELVDYFHQVVDQRQRQIELAASCSGGVAIERYERTAAASPVILGRVTDMAGAPVVGARLSLTPIGSASITGTDGRYRLPLPSDSVVSSRHVMLQVRALGYLQREHALTVGPRDSLQVDLSVCAMALSLDEAVVSAQGFAAKRSDAITNTQEAGVDEGGIVKLHGDHLVILRRGRLFTVAIGGDDLKPIAMVDAFGPGIDPRYTWYDELLVSGDRVVVIGYSYQRGGTELGIFDIDERGGLRPRGTYQLRSNDYYSSRNYASRLIGNKLIYYTPLYLPYGLEEPLSVLPSMRKWSPGTGGTGPDSGGRFVRIVTAQRVYHPAGWSASSDVALHTVTVCDLAAPELACQATVVIGPSGRVFYVSPGAVYVWMSDAGRWGGWPRPRRRDVSQAILCRMPLDGSAPSAVGVSGSPVDQFSFFESDDGNINVLVRSEGWGDWMWGPEWSGGSASLLRLPFADMGDGSQAAAASRYRALPTETGGTFHNRFVGGFLVYGNGSGWGRPATDGSILYVVPWGGGPITRLVLPHGTDRIEPMGADAVVVGADERDLHFTGIRLDRSPAVVQRYTLSNASQGELRSQGFFYRADTNDSGVLGLPVRGPGRPGWVHLIEGSASILFLRNHAARFDPLGTLEADGGSARDDACKASCVDWYGNARPLFIRDRIFALLGYELVEGRIDGGRISAVRRASFAPPVVRAVGG